MLVGVVSAQQGDKLLRIQQFGGLNTIAGDFAMKPSDARIAHNIDFGKNVGSISKRSGYDSVSVIAGQDSAIGLFGYYYSDGTQRLIFVTDSAGVGYGNVYASQKGTSFFTGVLTHTFYLLSDSIKNDYTYTETFYYHDTITISYLSDGDATRSEILNGLFVAITTDDSLPIYFDYFVPCVFCDDNVIAIVRERIEFLGSTVSTDQTQEDTTTGNLSTRIRTRWPIFSKPSFAVLDDRLYMSNGDGRGIVWDDTTARSFPLIPPGEPLITPIKHASGELDGEYRYTFYAPIDTTSSTKFMGIVSTPVRVADGRIMLSDFQWPNSDSLDTSRDTLYIRVYRTKANPGRLTRSTQFFNTGIVESITLSGDSAIGSKVIIDSISDAGLDTTDVLDIGEPTRVRSGNLQWRGYGSLGILKAGNNPGDSGTGGGTTELPFGLDDWVGWAWFQTYSDTAMQFESDTGRGMFIRDIVSDSFIVSLQSPAIRDSTLNINIYRAPLYAQVYDSAFVLNLGNPIFGLPIFVWVFRDTTFVGTPHLVETVSGLDTSYVDTMSWTTLKTHVQYGNTSAPILDRVFVHQNRMYGSWRSNLYFSDITNPTKWSPLSFIAIDRGDGDIITASFPARNSIRVLKQFSSYNIFQDANLDWNRREISSSIGALSAKSYARADFGHYYLSNHGVIFEGEGQFLERTRTFDLVSAPLKNFNELSTVTKSGAVGFYFDQKYMLNIGDTTYVYDERSKTWATWSLKFADATLYGVEDQVNFIPGDSMYFIKPGESNLYRFGTSQDDNGSSFSIQWRSGPLLMDPPGTKSIKMVEINANSDSTTDSLTFILYDETNTLIQNIDDGVDPNFLTYTELGNRFQIQGINPVTADTRFYRIRISSTSSASDNGMAVNGVDIYWRWTGFPIID